MANTGAMATMKNVYRGSGNVMVKRIVRMVLMSLTRVQLDIVELARSNVKIQIVLQLQLFVMEQMTVVMAVMKRNVPTNVRYLNLNVKLVADAY